MADLMLHIKDGYFFEAPKRLWRLFGEYQSLDQVPEFLRKSHPEVTSVGTWNEALAGKFLIPQPFGHLKSLYECESGFCISRYMILELVVAIILAAFFIRLAQKMRSGAAPRGGLWNMAEAILLFIRDGIARPAIGAHDADRFVPLLWTLFFFIVGCNLFGLVPWAGSPTASFAVTLALAGITLLTVFLSGFKQFGFIGFWKNQVPHMDLPKAFFFLKPVIFVIEVGGLLIRHGVLAFRLLANMAAGHLVLAAILGLILVAAGASVFQFSFIAGVSVLGSAVLSLLELFVAFLQGYVFTFLSALFIGAAIHHH
jgi:F-type H+-transporting ATPase subunit a